MGFCFATRAMPSMKNCKYHSVDLEETMRAVEVLILVIFFNPIFKYLQHKECALVFHLPLQYEILILVRSVLQNDSLVLLLFQVCNIILLTKKKFPEEFLIHTQKQNYLQWPHNANNLTIHHLLLRPKQKRNYIFS